MIIKSGSSGDVVYVNPQKQLSVIAEVQTEARHVAEEGNTFTISSGEVTTSASTAYRTILFFKNDEPEKDVHIGLIKLSSTVPGEWRWIKNPVSISNSGGVASVETTNFSSKRTFSNTSSIGSAASEITGGVAIIDFSGTFFGDLGGAFILGAGDSIAFEFGLESGTTQGDAAANLLIWTAED